MIDAVEMREHGHPRLFLHPRNERLAATGNDHVDGPLRTQHRADCGPVLRWHQLHGIGRQARLGYPRDHRRVDCTVAVDRLAAAAQNHGVARAKAQSRSVRSYVGAAFVDDPKHAYRHTHPFHDEAIGLSVRIDHLAHRIGQHRDLIDRQRNALYPVRIQP